MHEVQAEDKKGKLAFVIARGGSIATWASKNDVSRRTAFYWAKEPKVREEVEEIRRHSFNEALGRMNSRAKKAADGIYRLAASGESESIQLRAWRSLLVDQMAIARFSTLDQRVLGLEERAKAQKGYTGRPGSCAPAP
jgi:hypothetical protein